MPFWLISGYRKAVLSDGGGIVCHFLKKLNQLMGTWVISTFWLLLNTTAVSIYCF